MKKNLVAVKKSMASTEESKSIRIVPPDTTFIQIKARNESSIKNIVDLRYRSDFY
jgi:hypothetical protein